MRRTTMAVVAALTLLILTGGARATSSHAQSNPAQSLTGQRVTACKADVRFSFSVVSADWTSTIVDRNAARGAMWAVVVTDATNLGTRLEYIQGLAKLRDDRGREFSWRLFNGENLYVETDLAAQYGVTPSWEGIERGATARTVLIFEVAADARSLTLLPDNLSCVGAPAAPAPAAQSPVSSLIGRSITACKGDLRFRFDVVDAHWRKTLVDRDARGTAMWAIVIADVTNLGPRTDGAQGLAKLKDNQGREFSWRLFNGLDIYVEDRIAEEFGLRPSWELLTPGITERIVLTFEVAGDARSLDILPDNLACSR